MKKSPVWLTLTLLGSLALSACSSGSTSAPAGDEATGGEGTAPPASTDSKQVEIFSWWTGAGEEAGLKALIQVFKDKQPSIEVINAAVAGGAGTNAKAVLASRMQGEILRGHSRFTAVRSSIRAGWRLARWSR